MGLSMSSKSDAGAWDRFHDAEEYDFIGESSDEDQGEEEEDSSRSVSDMIKYLPWKPFSPEQDGLNLPKCACHRFLKAIKCFYVPEPAAVVPSAQPSVLERITIDGKDHDGRPRTVELGSEDAGAVAEWQAMLETVPECLPEEAVAQRQSEPEAPGSMSAPSEVACEPQAMTQTPSSVGGETMRRMSTTTSKRTANECSVCQQPYSGFGSVCGQCRCTGRKGSLLTCSVCNTFSTGFANGFCEDCGVMQCVTPLPQERPGRAALGSAAQSRSPPPPQRPRSKTICCVPDVAVGRPRSRIF